MQIVESIVWLGDRARILDQTRLPEEEFYLEITEPEAMIEAIRSLRIRGAPAIGIAGAYAVVLAARQLWQSEGKISLEELRKKANAIATARPTAVNLSWAISRMLTQAEKHAMQSAEALVSLLEREALAIHREDRELCRKIGRHGADLLFAPQLTILTHCNTGALATGGQGTALGVVYELSRRGCKVEVYADETRPLLQGARLTAWELQKAGIPVTVQCDNMAAALMATQKVDAVIVGADRIAANGDTANKIGTLGLAILAKHFGIPFYVAAPYSTFDPSIPTGKQIPIEQRHADEVLRFRECQSAPRNVQAWNPAFDVTPAELIGAFITDRGIIRPPFSEQIQKRSFKT